MPKTKMRVHDTIIPQEATKKVNQDGEEYIVLKTPNGELFFFRKGIVSDEDGFDMGKPNEAWVRALKELADVNASA